MMDFEELWDAVYARQKKDFWSDEWTYWHSEDIETELYNWFVGYEGALAPYIGTIPISDRDPDDPYWRLAMVVRGAAIEAGGFSYGSLLDGTSSTWHDEGWERLWQAAWALEKYKYSQKERQRYQRFLQSSSLAAADTYTEAEKRENWKRLRAPREPES